jgi:hypothetical protein
MSYRWPLLFVIFLAAPAAHAQGLEDFSNMSRAIGKEVSIVDQSGLVREGIVEAATADAVTLRFGSGTQSFPRATLASADRTRDRTTDGALKGAIFAAITGLLAVQGYPPGSDRGGMFAVHVATWTGIGWLFDAAQTHREPIYRAPAPAPMASLKLSFRF